MQCNFFDISTHDDYELSLIHVIGWGGGWDMVARTLNVCMFMLNSHTIVLYCNYSFTNIVAFLSSIHRYVWTANFVC